MATAIATPPTVIEHRPFLPNDRYLLFTDIDGTIVHYPEEMEQIGSIAGTSCQGLFEFTEKDTGNVHQVLKLPPSSTGMQGIISKRTLELFADWRKRGHLVVIVSGARTSTVLQRLPYLPACDAVASENGGRVWLHDQSTHCCCPLTEDWEWRESHAKVCGPVVGESVPPNLRVGLLWDVYRTLLAAGWSIDCNGYSTAFRVKVKAPKTLADLEAVRSELPAGLTSSFNLGTCDIYPATTGKEGVAQYLMRRFNVPRERCLLLCDDDNDLGLAAVVPRVFLPTVTTASMSQAAAAQPDKFVIAQRKGILATEEVLAAVLQQT